MRYRAIQECDRRYPIRLICRVLATLEERAIMHIMHGQKVPILEALVKQCHRIGEHGVAWLKRQDGIRARR